MYLIAPKVFASSSPSTEEKIECQSFSTTHSVFSLTPTTGMQVTSINLDNSQGEWVFLKNHSSTTEFSSIRQTTYKPLSLNTLMLAS